MTPRMNRSLNRRVAGLAGGLLAVFGTVPVAAQVPAPVRDTVTLRAETSDLGAGQAGWREQAVGLRRQWRPRHGAEVSLAQVRRFGLEDTRAAADYSLPLTPALTLGVEAAASPTHRVLARAMGGGRLAWEFAPRWLLQAGARSSHYTEATVRQGSLGLEHYLGAFSASLAWQPARALGADTQAWVARGAWYYGERSSASLTLARGQEATRVQADRLVLARVQTVALSGRHALAPAWGLAWSLERTQQGEFHTRQTLGLGLQHDF